LYGVTPRPRRSHGTGTFEMGAYKPRVKRGFSFGPTLQEKILKSAVFAVAHAGLA